MVPSAVGGAAAFVPEARELPVLADAVQGCRGCDLYKHATQAVFGEWEGGRSSRRKRAAIMMIGEQPGDHEDREGRPFVGPAGMLLNRCLKEAGLELSKVYVTNAVKHFKWEPRGKLRIHKKPKLQEVHACRPWLDAELEAVRPRLIVALGATAAQGLLGSGFRVTRAHGKVQRVEGLPPILATLHPSAILRAPDEEERHRQRAVLVEALRQAARLAA